ncbi:MAG: hypothetical protein S4CHLAM45_10280 [Chlamydiales bacterium]|nr:hypothetical protein [Chlamydiales bacterium]MCH9619523.1 hypothetical protein [Chlamydiales bacterium]MCH9623129.1 hypothetical protein [Chlamydiales bacterium]
MRRKSYKKYLGFVAALLLLFCLPKLFVEKSRVKSISFVSSLWKKLPLDPSCAKLEAENHLLRLKIAKLQGVSEECEDVLSARVIYRDPALWMSAFWVDIGEEAGVKKNSPVVSGRAVVGVVDYVGKEQSRIRLITDMALKPSVRVARGLPQNAAFVQHIDAVLRRIREPNVVAYLEKVREELNHDAQTWYLAKGVINGAGSPLWRDRTHSLKGYGFNYDFADDLGPARDLRTGKPLSGEGEGVSLIRENDLLITTGMDGIFPMGLHVAEVTKVLPLRVGACTYEIEAVPVIKNLDSLQTVFIIPKVGFIPDEDCSS